jgi:hypothetical protein
MMTRAGASAIAVMVLVAAAGGGCGGDASVTDNGREVTFRDFGCKSCRVVAESIAYLGNPDDTVAFREDVLPARDSRGRFYLSDLRGGLVYVFGPNGRLLTSFGKPGRGPGEFVGLRTIFVTPGDTLLVVGGPSIHVISPEYVHVREYRNLSGSLDELAATILSDGRILTGYSRHQFAVIDSVGRAEQRIKLQDIDTTACGECGERTYREARSPGSVWSGPLNTYRVEHHDLTGKLIRRFIRTASWYPAWGPREIEARNIVVELSRPRLVGVREGRDGVVWTHVSLVENGDKLGAIDEDVPKQMAQLWSRVRTHIEAIDQDKPQLLAGTVLDGLVVPLTGDYAAQLCVDDVGGWAWKILRFHVEGRTK